MTAKEASMYEPRVGDLVRFMNYAWPVEVAGTYGPDLWRLSDQRGRQTCAHVCALEPLRPDAPGQRVRDAFGDGLLGTTRAASLDSPLNAPGFFVRWDIGATSVWTSAALIRIADQAPAAQVVPPCPETPGDVCAAIYGTLAAPGPALLDAAAAQWVRTVGTPSAAAPLALPEVLLRDPPQTCPTCQHCGSGIVAGLLRDTCPRGCDLTLRAAEPEPEFVLTTTWGKAWVHANGADAALPESRRERVWVAQGRGRALAHPTREGALAAWREAVRAKGGGR